MSKRTPRWLHEEYPANYGELGSHRQLHLQELEAELPSHEEQEQGPRNAQPHTTSVDRH